MMLRLLAILGLCGTTLLGQDLVGQYAPSGKLIISDFQSAPFPHPARKDGHKYGTKFFSAEEHYNNSQVAIFVPKGFKPGSKTDFVVHFHGWENIATNAIGKYRLIDQLVASKRNAILIVPQGPFKAPDSFDGKLEDDNGFKRFMAEAIATLKTNNIISSDKIGEIILSGHSGGYEVISSILVRGGLNDHIKEVWLFDALYANTERFMSWFTSHKGRFIDIYTDHGGTRENTLSLMEALKENSVPFYSSPEDNASMRDLEKSHLVFLHSALPHDEVMQHQDTFLHFLSTSSLGQIKR